MKKKLFIEGVVLASTSFGTLSAFADTVAPTDMMTTTQVESSTSDTSTEAIDPSMMDNTPVTTMEPTLTSIEPIMVQEDTMIKDKEVMSPGMMTLEGTYWGYGKVKLDNSKTVVTVKSPKTSTLVKGDKVTLTVKGTIMSFKLISLSKNGEEVVMTKPTIVKTKTTMPGRGVFMLTGQYDGKDLVMEKGRVRLEISSKYIDQTVTITVKGTMNSFKVLNVEMVEVGQP